LGKNRSEFGKPRHQEVYLQQPTKTPLHFPSTKMASFLIQFRLVWVTTIENYLTQEKAKAKKLENVWKEKYFIWKNMLMANHLNGVYEKRRRKDKVNWKLHSLLAKWSEIAWKVLSVFFKKSWLQITRSNKLKKVESIWAVTMWVW
jgi:hypothetical protein